MNRHGEEMLGDRDEVLTKPLTPFLRGGKTDAELKIEGKYNNPFYTATVKTA